MDTHSGNSSTCFHRPKLLPLLLGLILLFLAHATALLFRIQPAVSLWFPPSGVAIALTFFWGPIGALLTWIASFTVAPLWGSEGWSRFASVTDATEPLVAWWLYCRFFKGSLLFKGLRDVGAFLISVPLMACSTSAILGTLALVLFGRMSMENLSVNIPHWWLGNALGVMAIAPAMLLLLTPWLQKMGWIEPTETESEFQTSITQPLLKLHYGEAFLVLLAVAFMSVLTVYATKISIFVTLHFSLLSSIPIIWAATRLRLRGGVLVATFSVLITLLNYLLFYPSSILLPQFPVNPDLLHTHKLSLLLQSVIALLIGTAMAERAAIAGMTADIAARKQVEVILRQVNDRFQLASEAVNSAIYDWSISQNQVEWTSGIDRVFGYTPDAIEPTLEWYLERIHPEDRERVKNEIQAVQLQGGRYHLEYRTRNAENEEVWVSDQGLTVQDANDQVTHLIGSITNISKRKQAEAEIQWLNRELERRVTELNKILDVAPIGLAIAEDPQCRYIRINSYLRKLLKAPSHVSVSKTAEGEHLAYTIYQNGRQVPAEELPIQRAALESKEVQNWEFELVLTDGTRLDIVGYAAPLFDEQGVVRGAVGAFVDLTELKQSGALLRENEERLRLALNAANQGLYDLNVQTGEAIVSPEYARMLGYEPEEFQESNAAWCDRLHPDDRAHTFQTYADYVAGRLPEYRLEFRQRSKSGNWVWILSIGKIVSWDEQGRPLRMLGIHTDISDRKEIEAERAQLLEREQAARQQAEAASRMKDEFLAIVSHELRSPLNGILGWSRLLRTRNLDATTTERALASIERNAQAQTQLIEDLLDISRIIRGTVRLILRPVNLTSIVQAALDTVRPTAEAKSMQLVAHLPNLGLVSGDSERLQQVVWNLLSNAIKFTDEGGRVEVKLERFAYSPKNSASSNPHIRLLVMDTGKGIRSEFLPYIFDRFRQADSTTTRTQGGLGLGLSIVRNLVELHGGTVWAESAGEGKGSSFFVELPLLMDIQQVEEEDAPTLASLPDSLAGLRVLVVDDEADTRDFLATTLEQYGAMVATAASAAEALSLLQQTQPNILLSDIGMPDEDGYSLIRKVRSLPPHSGGQIPAAALTAYVRGDDRLQAISAGFQMHVPKPIDPVQLLKVVAKLTGRYR